MSLIHLVNYSELLYCCYYNYYSYCWVRRTCHSVHVRVTEQLCGVSFLLLPYGSLNEMHPHNLGKLNTYSPVGSALRGDLEGMPLLEKYVTGGEL